MVWHAHFKKHIIALGGWLLMYTSGPPPRFGKRPSFLRIFFCYLPLGEGAIKKNKKKLTNVSFGLTYIHTP